MRKVILAVILALIGIPRADAGGFFVSPTGSDSNPGTVSQPWRTLGKANSTLVSGDTVVVLAGVYSEGIAPVRSGTASAPIVYLAAANQQAVIRTGTGINLTSGASYIVVAGFRFESTYRSADVKGSRGVIIRLCRFFGGNATYECLKFEDVTYCKVQHCYIDRQDPPVNAGNGIDLNGSSSYNVIENDTIIHVSHVAIISAYGGNYHHNVIRNNLLHDNHTHLSPQNGADRYLIENNKVYYSGLINADATGKAFQPTCTNSIVRYNVIYADSGNPKGWRKILAPTVMFSSAEFGVKNMAYNRMYNNLFYGETDEGYPVSAVQLIDNDRDKGTRLEQNRFVNNIIAGGTNYQVMDENGGVSDAEFSHSWAGNLLWSGTPGDVVIYARTANGPNEWSLEQAKEEQPTWWEANNVEGDPLFVNTVGQGPAKDFTLEQGSAAIDAGVHLTVATQSGSNSTTLRVDDAQYFMDGWGIIEPDSLLIEGSPVPVGAANVDYAAGFITLQSARSWTAGARVWYYRSDRFRGNAPDIGPLESPFTRTISTGTLRAPVLRSPVSRQTGVPLTPRLSWLPVTGATSYQVQLTASPSFAPIDINVQNLTDTFFVAPTLLQNATYYWRVRAAGASGPGSWSAVRSFTTLRVSAPTQSLLLNPDFESGTSGWIFYTNGTGEFTSTGPGYQGSQSARIAVTQAGTNVQLYQPGVVLQPASRYRLSFVAFSTTGRDVDVSLIKHTPSYHTYGLSGQRFNLGTGWQQFSVEFNSRNMAAIVDNARMQFWLAPYALAGDVYWLDSLSLVRVGLGTPDPPVLADPVIISESGVDLARITWTASFGADSYRLQVAGDSLFNSILSDQAGLTGTEYTVGGLREGGRFFVRMMARNAAGDGPFGTGIGFSMPIHVVGPAPKDFVLEQNYPNPFNPLSRFRYGIPVPLRVRIEVFDILGRRVKTLLDDERLPGVYEIWIDGTSWSSGIYFMIMQAGSFVDIRRLLLVR